ncbi:hypothetical protein NDU88_001788 [Pleurodeles waltl]|uniref:Uncharacterized protein n=1 Tax=Pleurodeles waltl TaxID=8319 RepID=A0AAV7MKS0_PLEWA|nr:hypothetical protein NDU88_001788 [Pleurodeles waltl]
MHESRTLLSLICAPKNKAKRHLPNSPSAQDRLSGNAAPDSPELRPQLLARDVEEGWHSFQDNENAGTRLGNPDIRFPRNTIREEGLSARKADEEEDDERNADRVPQETREERRFGNTEDSPPKNDHPWEKKEVEPPALRHVPGGTWLTKVQSFIKDNLFLKGKSNGRRREGGDKMGRGEGDTWRGQKE